MIQTVAQVKGPQSLGVSLVKTLHHRAVLGINSELESVSDGGLGPA